MSQQLTLGSLLPRKRKPRPKAVRDPSAGELVEWFLSRKPDLANPEDRKQVAIAKRLLAKFGIDQVKRAVVIRREKCGQCLNLFEVQWSDPESGKMYLTLANEVPPKPDQTNYIGWDEWVTMWGALAQQQGLWDGSLPAAYAAYKEQADARHQSHRAGDPGRRSRPGQYQGRRTDLPRPAPEAWDH